MHHIRLLYWLYCSVSKYLVIGLLRSPRAAVSYDITWLGLVSLLRISIRVEWNAISLGIHPPKKIWHIDVSSIIKQRFWKWIEQITLSLIQALKTQTVPSCKQIRRNQTGTLASWVIISCQPSTQNEELMSWKGYPWCIHAQNFILFMACELGPSFCWNSPFFEHCKKITLNSSVIWPLIATLGDPEMHYMPWP